MAGRVVLSAVLAVSFASIGRAQDVPGIEICTVDKTMERRTSCLQSNVDFLVKMINKLTLDHQAKIDAAGRQIEALKSAVVALQKAEAQSASKPTSPAAKDAPAPAPPAAKGDAK